MTPNRRVTWQVTSGDGNSWPRSAARRRGHSRRGRSTANGCGASACSYRFPPTMRSRRSAWGHSCRLWHYRAGPSAATCGSTFVGLESMPTIFADTQPNWPRSRRTSSSPMALRPSGRYSRRPAACRSSFRSSAIQSAPASSGSLARPGGNTTGFMISEYGMGGKWLELLKEIAPDVTRVAVLRDPTNSAAIAQFGVIQAMALSLRVGVSPIDVRDAVEIERAVTAFARSAHGGLIATSSGASALHHALVIALAAKHKLPTVYYERFFVAAGGLISYGPDYVDQYRKAAYYVDRILKGERPADLPVQAPTKYQLVINLKTAKALSLEVPPTLLARADEVIE